MPEIPSESPDAPVEPSRPWWKRKRFGGSFLVVSIALHLLFGVGATYYVVQSIAAKRAKAFQGGPPNPSRSQKAVEHRVQVAKQKQTSSAPAPPKRVAVAGLAKVSLPEMPSVPVTAAVNTAKLGGMGGTGGFGVGPGMMGSGKGTGSGGGGIPVFGLRENTGSSLRGTFYDLKQTASGEPSELAGGSDDPIRSPVNEAYSTLLGQFIKGGMNESAVSRFFRGPAPLFTTQVFIPTMSSDKAPQAFNLADKVKPKRWIVVYRGNVTPPEGGSYRFVGWADDILAVRLNGRIVLEASLGNPSGLRPKTEYHFGGINAPFFAGDPVSVSAGNSYPMEIVIGEKPGGEFNAFLLLEKVGAHAEKGGAGSPSLPIFKLAPSNTATRTDHAPEVAADTPWSVWKATSGATGGGLLDQLRRN